MTENWNHRYRENMGRIKSGEVREVARVVKGLMHRDASRGQHGSEHTLFFHGANVEALVDRYKFRTEHESSYKTGLNFADNAVDQCTGGAAENVQVTFNTSKSTSFTYHADSGKYTAVQYKADYKDGATGEAVPFTNLLILSADMKTVDSR